MMSILRFAKAFVPVLLVAALPARAEEASRASRGQTIYAPVYSHVHHGNNDKSAFGNRLLLSAMLSVRNTDPERTIVVRAVDYHDTDGKLVRRFLTEPRKLAPLASFDAFIENKDEAGGAGAKFLVVWDAEAPTSPPLVETVHAYFFGSPSLAFVTRGVPIAVSGR